MQVVVGEERIQAVANQVVLAEVEMELAVVQQVVPALLILAVEEVEVELSKEAQAGLA
jgi:hypothetical protein